MNNFLFILLFPLAMIGNNKPVFTETGVKLSVSNFNIEFTNSYEEILELSFLEGDGSLEFKTTSPVNFIQILNDKGELELQMPISSSFINIAVQNFERGGYNINVLLENKVIQGNFEIN